MACLTVSQMMTFSVDKTNKPIKSFIGLLVYWFYCHLTHQVLSILLLWPLQLSSVAAFI